MHRYCYALHDVSVSPEKPGDGDANSKEVLAFRTKVARSVYLIDRKKFDWSARPLTSLQAKKFALKIDKVPAISIDRDDCPLCVLIHAPDDGPIKYHGIE
jgi:hypothetical protein